MRLPLLETERLLIREFAAQDLEAVHHLLDVALAETDTGTEGALTLAARRRWLEWTVLNYEHLAYLRQPPYGDRAIVLRRTGELIGACGLVPCLAPFAQIPVMCASLDSAAAAAGSRASTAFDLGSGAAPGMGHALDPAAVQEPLARHSPEVGLYWAIAPTHQRQGYATEAARALAGYAFAALKVRRLVATTGDDNIASIGVMRKLGMRLDRNPYAEPHWLQVVGVLD